MEIYLQAESAESVASALSSALCILSSFVTLMILVGSDSSVNFSHSNNKLSSFGSASWKSV